MRVLPMGRLRLQYDGVLAEAWNPLDPEPPYLPPDTWNAPHVQHRFAEAISTLLKLPLGRFWPADIRNCWPAYYDEWADLLAQLGDGADGFEQTWKRRNRVRVMRSARQISVMERALEWPGRHLPHHLELAWALNICSLAQARELPVEDVVRRGKHAGVRSAAEWHRLALEAAHRIAVGLQVDRVVVF
jgi:hypothetical protein